MYVYNNTARIQYERICCWPRYPRITNGCINVRVWCEAVLFHFVCTSCSRCVDFVLLLTVWGLGKSWNVIFFLYFSLFVLFLLPALHSIYAGTYTLYILIYRRIVSVRKINIAFGRARKKNVMKYIRTQARADPFVFNSENYNSFWQV